MEHILEGLNEAQKASVTSPASVLQVLAPPGSGKTKTLTARVAYLIAHDGLVPKNIIVCTFTVKASREMKERICRFLGAETASKLILGTFHSIARRYLVCYGKHIGLSEKFGIADSSDSAGIVTRIIKKHEFTLNPNQARSRISRLKAKGTTSEAFSASFKKAQDQEFAVIYSKYQDHLRVSNLLDYDDLLVKCVELLHRYPECVSNIDAILIDEFQDTNNVQYDLMELFAQHKNRITIVGDPDQSIYGWRSAEIGNLRLMQDRFPDIHVSKLEENYRSSGSILITAQEVIEQDDSRPAKRLMPTHSVGFQPVLRKLRSAHEEAKWIVSEIRRISDCSAGLLKWNDFAILLRSAALSRLIETALGQAGIPYRMVGGHRFYDRHEIKVVLDYLRAINHPDHNDAIARILNVPPRGIGDASIQKLIEEAEGKQTTVWKLILNIVRGYKKPPLKMSNKAQNALGSFSNLILNARKNLTNPGSNCASLGDYLVGLLKKIGIKQYLKSSKSEDCDSRWANVEELVVQAKDFVLGIATEEGDNDENSLQAIEVAREGTLEEALSQFLANVALASEVRQDQEDSQSAQQVTLSTIHAAKGLEWPVVFIPATFEGCIPHSRAEDTNEERRLLYVAMTRAQALLYLSIPIEDSRGDKTTLSQFLSSSRMESMFRKAGEDCSFEMMKEIACILKRACISLNSFETAIALIENARDNQWPLCGEPEISDENGNYFQYDRDDERFHKEQSCKRARFHGSNKGSTHYEGISMTKIQPRSEYSIANTTMSKNFVTAASVFSSIQHNHSANETSTARGSKATSLHHPTMQKRKIDSTIDDARGQMSMTGFLKKRSHLATQETGRALSTSILARSSDVAPLRDISNEEPLRTTPSKTGESAKVDTTSTSTPPTVLNVISTPRNSIPPFQMRRKTLGVRRSMNGWESRMARERPQ